MIRLQDMTPDVYYNQSRDFQFIGRLFDVVLNAVKTNTDLVRECPLSDNSDNRLIDLMALTLGFKSKHNYNVNQLKALCSAFQEILKNKGSIKSIELALTTLYQVESVDQEFSYDLNDDHTLLTLYVPNSLGDINLFKDLLNYILPAGMSTRLIRTFLETKPPTTPLGVQDKVNYALQGSMTTLFQKEYNEIPYPDDPAKTTDHNKVPTIYRDSIYSNAQLFQQGNEKKPSEKTASNSPANNENEGEN